ncbi:hypothetical protein GSI_07634 [Ganoderma sinense ZZ0214-1]|nr:hypothetical protein GSI_07634 [Ganoderma sinense ZZ0214-1]
MTSFLSPTPITQHLHPSSHRPTPTAFQVLHPRGNDDDGDNDNGDHEVWPSQCNLPPGCVFPALLVCTYPPGCFPPLPLPSHASTSTLSFFSSPLPISTTTRTVTQTPIPSGSDSAASTTPGNHPTAPTMPISSSGSPGEIVPDNRGLSSGGLVGVIVGSVGGLLLLLLFLWMLRRGTFGSGTLFGFRYGDARKPGWGGAAQEMRQKGKGGYRISASEPPSDGSTLSVPFFAGSKPPSYSHVPSNSSSSLRKAPPLPSLSPPPWSTSSSAFDNAYAVSSISAHTRSHTYSASVSVSMSLSVSDNSTLVSEPASLRPPERHSSAGANASPLTRYLNAYHPTSIPLPARPPSPGETVSTSMVSFDRSDPADFEHDPSEAASEDARSEWGAETSESTQPLGRHPGWAG